MRRLFALSALGLLGAVLGCHTAGICDCEGLPDPCGGPPLPFHDVHAHGPHGGGHAIVGTAPGSATLLNGNAVNQGSSLPGGTIIQQSPIGPGTTIVPQGTVVPQGAVIPQDTGVPQGTVIVKPSGSGATGVPIQVSPPMPMVPLVPKQ